MDGMSSEEWILVTGASGGVGVPLVEHLLENGWRNVLCHYRTHSGSIAKLLEQHGIDPAGRLFQADLTCEEQVARLRESAERVAGPLFGLVNLAGGSTNRMSWKISRAEFHQVIDQNLLTTFLTCREFTPSMREQGRGRMINISSVVAYTGAAGAAHYCAAKAAIVGFSRALSVELAPKGIAVSVIALGYLQYGLIRSIPEEQREQLKARIPAARFGSASELGGLVRYLLSDAGAYSNGQVYHLNGGIYSG
jgi:NAD(P)-dependent dehydrogenase (short-subunit alcohol dehydrogenase family)